MSRRSRVQAPPGPTFHFSVFSFVFLEDIYFFSLTGPNVRYIPLHFNIATFFFCLHRFALQADSLSGFHAKTHIPVVVGGQMRYEVTGDLLYKVIHVPPINLSRKKST